MSILKSKLIHLDFNFAIPELTTILQSKGLKYGFKDDCDFYHSVKKDSAWTIANVKKEHIVVYDEVLKEISIKYDISESSLYHRTNWCSYGKSY